MSINSQKSSSSENNGKKLFELFYTEQYGKVVNYVLKKIGNKEDAEDIVHNAFESCYRNLDNYDASKSTIATWVYVSVNNRLKNYYRDRKNNDDIDSYAEVIPDLNATEAEQVHYLKECRTVLEKVLNKLSDRNRIIIIRRYFEDCSLKDIALELGMSEVNVRVSVGRILQKMKKLMVEEGWEEVSL